MLGRRGHPLRRLVGDEVGRDEARPPGVLQIGREALDTVLHDRIPVGHDEQRSVDPGTDTLDGLEAVPQPEPVAQGGLRRALDREAVHHRITVGQTELDDVDAVLDQGDRRVDARVEAREADRQIPDEGTRGLVVPSADRVGDGAHEVSSAAAASSRPK